MRHWQAIRESWLTMASSYRIYRACSKSDQKNSAIDLQIPPPLPRESASCFRTDLYMDFYNGHLNEVKRYQKMSWIVCQNLNGLALLSAPATFREDVKNPNIFSQGHVSPSPMLFSWNLNWSGYFQLETSLSLKFLTLHFNENLFFCNIGLKKYKKNYREIPKNGPTKD